MPVLEGLPPVTWPTIPGKESEGKTKTAQNTIQTIEQTIIVALPEIEPAALTVRRIRDLNPKVAILARAHGLAEAERLGVVGASEVIQPEVEASATLIRHALAWFGVPKERILDHVEQYRLSMERKRTN